MENCLVANLKSIKDKKQNNEKQHEKHQDRANPNFLKVFHDRKPLFTIFTSDNKEYLHIINTIQYHE